MPVITLPDGSQRSFDQAITVMQLAESIGAGLAKATIAGRIDGRLVDACQLIEQDAKVEIVTLKDADGLHIMRHSCAHLFGHALKQLYPDAKMAIGPVIEHGFYYDIDMDTKLSPEDLPVIQKRMEELAKTGYAVTKKMTPRDEAIALFQSRGEDYKLELIRDLANETQFGMYHHQEYVDMCVGPHVPNMSHIKAFALTHVSGAYWRGNSDNKMLQRVYGIAFPDKKALEAHQTMMAEAEKRDHRKLGRALNLFHFHEEAPGAVFWHPKGWSVFQTLIDYMRDRQKRAGYIEVNTPDVMDRSLWEVSGHWFNYRENMFTTQTEDGRLFALKPMNCPGAMLMYAQGKKSYRDLPIRMGEFGKVHRYEPSGALHGLMRVRHFTQDDAHIFCTPDQMAQECKDVVALVLDIYKEFGFDNVRIKLSTRPEKRIGTDETWDILEAALADSLESMGLDYILFPGEGAFYGPKLEFVLRDAIGRDWQCGTLQVDMSLPERFDLSYTDADNTAKRPVMLHRALFGSLERFVGILIEHYEAKFPLWLSPVHAVLMPIVDKQADYLQQVAKQMREAGLSVETDLRNEKVGFKIREHTLARVPFMLVAGDKEMEQGALAVRTREGQDLGVIQLEDLIAGMQKEIASKGKEKLQTED
jgi:threonyl-tRNA synthetase